ncbi:MAG TPA: CPBP family intramembrane glutamic endopeptidase [Trueperaceae bacterium]
MTVPAALRALGEDALGLFAGRNGKVSVYLLAALLLQAGYWYLGSPGPYLLGGVARTLPTALVNIGWALGLFLMVPLLLMMVLGDSPRQAGLRLGDWRFGWRVTAVGAVVAVLLMAVGARDAAVQAAYPWSGEWPAMTLWHLPAWAALYALYYLSFEFFYRGFMLRVLEPTWGVGAALWMQTIASVLVHLGKPPAETLAAIPAGIIFGLLAVRSRSIVWPILLHLVVGLATDLFSLAYQGRLFA